MAVQKPSIPKGTRDFGPEEMSGREYIFDTLKSVFRNFGYHPLETPAVEKLEVLTGKYGEEGDRLIFKILDSGDFLTNVEDLSKEDAKSLLPKIAGKALRYDLTVPFARYVVMNQHKLNFPFKRYQVQPVWRADRPQKGRYREFYQCDVDVIGTDSLLNEFELIRICDEGFSGLGVENVTLKINNRKILEGIAEYFNASDSFVEFITILDKLDKIGEEGVINEWNEKGLNVSAEKLVALKNAVGISDAKEKVMNLETLLSPADGTQGAKGIAEIKELMGYLDLLKLKSINVDLDIFLARGLTYYTGTIFEAVTSDFRGSILGGGRYDNLTGVFGLNGISGVGISFGADRIYDVMMQRGLFENKKSDQPKVLFINFGGDALKKAIQLMIDLNDAGVHAEIYPDNDKPKKQFKYADSEGFTHAVIIGDHELESGNCKLKDLSKGEEIGVPFQDIKSRF